MSKKNIQNSLLEYLMPLYVAATSMLQRQVYVALSSRIESGLDPKNWETWVTLLMHQVGIIHKFSKLFGCDLDS